MRHASIQPSAVLTNAPTPEIKYAKIRAVEERYGWGDFIFQLIRKGLVRTVLYKSSRKAKGYRLIDLRSLWKTT